MVAVRIALARVRALFRRDATADEIREELQFHVQMRADEYARHGMDAREARLAALRRFGNLAVIQDRGYDVRGGGVMESTLQDLKYGFRQLAQHRSFSSVAVLTLALGIGASAALFSVIDAALLRSAAISAPGGASHNQCGGDDPQPRPRTLCALDRRRSDLAQADHDHLASRHGPR